MDLEEKNYRKCPICHCKLHLDDFFRYNTKGRAKHYYKVCNRCILKSRDRQNKQRNMTPLEKDKKDVDNMCNELIKKISNKTYINE